MGWDVEFLDHKQLEGRDNNFHISVSPVPGTSQAFSNYSENKRIPVFHGAWFFLLSDRQVLEIWYATSVYFGGGYFPESTSTTFRTVYMWFIC